MKIIRTITFIIFLFLFGESYAKEFNFLTDSSNKVVYLELYKDVASFVGSNNKADIARTLQTLVLSDFEKKRNFKMIFPALLDFLKTCSTLENLHFRNTSKVEGDLKFEHLIEVLKSVENTPLKQFSWEYQKEIDDEGLIGFFNKDSSNILSRVKTLSFKGTEFDDDSFFPGIMIFDSLQSLDLSYSISTNLNFGVLITRGMNFPELVDLNLNGLDVSLGNTVKISKTFPRLSKLSIKIDEFRTNSYLDMVNKISGVFKNLESLTIKTEYENSDSCNSNAEFVLGKDNSICANNLGYNKMILRRLPGLKSIGGFARFHTADITKINHYFQKKETNPSLFFSSQQELEFFESAFPNSKRKLISLAGPLVNSKEIKSILDNRESYNNVSDIFLIGTNCSNEELLTLRNLSEDLSIRIHKVDSFQSSMIYPSFDFNTFHMESLQRIMQQNMQNSIKQSIPKFK